MDAALSLQQIAESLGTKPTVKSGFGDPISVDGKTVVPIARVAYASERAAVPAR